MSSVINPFSDVLPKEIPLPDAPLVRVITQVRFPPVLVLEQREFIASFQETIRATYPILKPEQARGIILGSQGVTAGPQQVAWRFADVDGRWRVSVTPEFVAIETTSYKSRDDFLDRLRFVLEAFAARVNPALVERLGVRYIDRVTGTAFANIEDLIKKEVLGILTTSISNFSRHSLTETFFDLPESKQQILARWGLLPANATADPNAIEAIDEPSWILDIDVFSKDTMTFNPEKIVAAARGYAERIYALFRWAVTDNFLRQYGGKP